MERRVLLEARRTVRQVDLQPPRQRGRASEQFLVEVVAEPTDCLRKHNSRRAVHEHERGRCRRRASTSTAIRPPPTAPQIDRPPFQISNADEAAFAPLVSGEQVVDARR